MDYGPIFGSIFGASLFYRSDLMIKSKANENTDSFANVNSSYRNKNYEMNNK